MKYDAILKKLDKHTLYIPSTIASFAEENSLLRSKHPKQRMREKLRIRIALGRYANNHGFPDEGDGMVTIPGQAPFPGWFGWRWQDGLL